MDARPRGGERPTGEVMGPFLGFLSEVAREPDDMCVLVQEGSEGVSQGSGQPYVAMFSEGK